MEGGREHEYQYFIFIPTSNIVGPQVKYLNHDNGEWTLTLMKKIKLTTSV